MAHIHLKAVIYAPQHEAFQPVSHWDIDSRVFALGRSDLACGVGQERGN